jgi:hypothetical protein
MTSSSRDTELVKVAYAGDEAEAELIQGLLRLSDVQSVVRRTRGFDVPEFLAAGPRDVLVAAADVPLARDILRDVDSGDPPPPAEAGADRRPWVRAGLLIVVALVVLVVCLAADVFG